MRTEILVIDDDPAVLETYGRILARLGHRVRLLGEAEAARDDPDLLRDVGVLILDQRMPRLCGLDLLAALRGRQSGGARPAILLITAVLTEELRSRAAGLGVTEVIEKPVTRGRLLASVRAALGARP